MTFNDLSDLGVDIVVTFTFVRGENEIAMEVPFRELVDNQAGLAVLEDDLYQEAKGALFTEE